MNGPNSIERFFDPFDPFDIACGVSLDGSSLEFNQPWRRFGIFFIHVLYNDQIGGQFEGSNVSNFVDKFGTR